MRHLIIAVFLAAILLPPSTPIAHAEESPKVFMFVRDGSRDLDLMLTEEVGVMRRMLEDAGFTVDIATPSNEPMVADSITLVPTVELAEVDITQYAGLILPCMGPAAGSTLPAAVEAIIEQALAQGKPIAAARASVVELAQAGGIVGREYAFARSVDLKKRPEFVGGVFVGTGVARDSNISTSGICPLVAKGPERPDGTVDLTQSFIESLTESD